MAMTVASPTRTRKQADPASEVNRDLAYTPPTARALWLLTRAQRAFDTAMDIELRDTGVTWTQYTVLEAVATSKTQKGISSAAVARRLKVSAQSAHPLVSGLEEDGLLIRSPSGIGFGRVMYINLTPMGLDVYSRARRVIKAFERKLASRFGEGQYEGMLSYLEMLISDLEQASE